MSARVLIVEDEKAIQLALRGLLRRDGYDVDLADTGEDALRKLSEQPYDLVITDLALGRGISGMDVLRASKEAREKATGELKKLRTHGIDAKDLARVKNQMKGSLMLSLESSHSRMSKLAKDELTQGNHVSLEQMIAEIDRVTTDQVYRVAQTLLDQRCLSITALGPIPTKSLQSFAS